MKTKNVLFILLVSTVSCAQAMDRKPTREELYEERLNTLKEELGLDSSIHEKKLPKHYLYATPYRKKTVFYDDALAEKCIEMREKRKIKRKQEIKNLAQKNSLAALQLMLDTTKDPIKKSMIEKAIIIAMADSKLGDK